MSAVPSFDGGVTVLGGKIRGQISVSISAMHWSKWRSRRVLHPLSDILGTDGSGGGSGVDRYLATSRAQSEYPARYLSVPIIIIILNNTNREIHSKVRFGVFAFAFGGERNANAKEFIAYRDYLNGDASGNDARSIRVCRPFPILCASVDAHRAAFHCLISSLRVLTPSILPSSD